MYEVIQYVSLLFRNGTPPHQDSDEKPLSELLSRRPDTPCGKLVVLRPIAARRPVRQRSLHFKAWGQGAEGKSTTVCRDLASPRSDLPPSIARPRARPRDSPGNRASTLETTPSFSVWCTCPDETCPISTEGWTRHVHFVRGGGGGGAPSRCCRRPARRAGTRGRAPAPFPGRGKAVTAGRTRARVRSARYQTGRGLPERLLTAGCAPRRAPVCVCVCGFRGCCQ